MWLSDSLHSIWRGPPGRSTWQMRSTRPSRTPATTVAHAPVPQARVAPAPRSHTRMRIWLLLSTWQNSVLVRAGKTTLFSNLGPISARGRSLTSSVPFSNSSEPSFPNMMAWGLPIDTMVASHVSPSTSKPPATTESPLLGGMVVGTLAPSRMGSPMSTHTCPSAVTSGMIRPARVCTRWLAAPWPSMSETKRERQRMPLPHISGSLPSEL
mmetsp:Transcript_45097/g.143621  ORF Transcript_45097/g.143621 Transcript_45097/m.143621 type:complete len:211 (-) Transcript_45097:335-967(-)